MAVKDKDKVNLKFMWILPGGIRANRDYVDLLRSAPFMNTEKHFAKGNVVLIASLAIRTVRYVLVFSRRQREK